MPAGNFPSWYHASANPDRFRPLFEGYAALLRVLFLQIGAGLFRRLQGLLRRGRVVLLTALGSQGQTQLELPIRDRPQIAMVMVIVLTGSRQRNLPLYSLRSASHLPFASSSSLALQPLAWRKLRSFPWIRFGDMSDLATHITSTNTAPKAWLPSTLSLADQRTSCSFLVLKARSSSDKVPNHPRSRAV